MNKALFILIILIFPALAYSQNYFCKGYVVKNNGDTIKGLTFYIDGKKKVKKCVFRRFDLASEFSFGTESIKSFGYSSGERYEADGKVFKQVNENSDLQYRKKPVLIDIAGKRGKFGVLIGTDIYGLSAKPFKPSSSIPQLDFMGPMFCVGAFYNYPLSRKKNKWYLHLEVDFSTKKNFYAYGEVKNYYYGTYRSDNYYQLQFIKIPYGLNYLFSVNKLNFNIGFGFSLNQIFNSSYTRTEEVESINHVVTTLKPKSDISFDNVMATSYLTLETTFKSFNKNFLLGVKREISGTRRLPNVDQWSTQTVFYFGVILN